MAKYTVGLCCGVMRDLVADDLVFIDPFNNLPALRLMGGVTLEVKACPNCGRTGRADEADDA